MTYGVGALRINKESMEARNSNAEQNPGICRLCLRTRKLQNSHIIPKSIYRASGILERGKQKKFELICFTHPRYSEKNMQDAIKEYLLCWDCEQKIKIWEDYFLEKRFGKDNPFASIQQPGFFWINLDYSRMKLFVLSILWRMSVSSHPLYANVSLGPHEERIRKMLYNDDPGEEWKYGTCLAFIFLGKKPLGDVFSQPRRFSWRSRVYYVFMMAGFAWYIFVQSHPPSKSETKGYLSKTGQWVIPILQTNDLEFVKREILQYRNYRGLSVREVEVNGSH